MDSPLPTEQPYSNGEPAGMAVSYPSSIPCQPLAHRIRISRMSSPAGSCCLRDALFDLGLGYVHHPRSMSCFTHEASVLSLPIFRSVLILLDVRHAEPPFTERDPLRSHSSRDILSFPSHMQPRSSRWLTLHHRLDCRKACVQRHNMHSSRDSQTNW